MTLNLHDQLREYGDHFRSALPPVEVEDVVGIRPTAEPLRQLRRTPQWRRRLAVTAITAVTALLLIGGTALLVRSPGGIEQPPATEPAPTTVTTVPTTATSGPPEPGTTAPQGALGGEDWTALEVPTGGAGGFIADVAADEGGLVAVGYECNDPCTTTSAAIWTSTDGSEWRRAARAGEVLGEGRLEAVSRGSAGWVAMGLQQSEAGGSDIAIWWSGNGQDWQQAPAIAEFTGTWRVPLDLAATDSRLIAVGTGMDDAGIFARVWSSNDGLTWTVTAELRDVELVAVSSFGAGFLAFGNAVDDDNFVAAVWTSEDGAEWTRVLDQTEVFGGQLGAISADAGAAIAIGGMPETAWVSFDGVSWARVEDLELPIETRAVLAEEKGFTIVGRGAWWTSPDGINWQRMDEELFTDAAVAAIVRAGSRLVAAGARSGQVPTVWLQNPTEG